MSESILAYFRPQPATMYVFYESDGYLDDFSEQARLRAEPIRFLPLKPEDAVIVASNEPFDKIFVDVIVPNREKASVKVEHNRPNSGWAFLYYEKDETKESPKSQITGAVDGRYVVGFPPGEWQPAYIMRMPLCAVRLTVSAPLTPETCGFVSLDSISPDYVDHPEWRAVKGWRRTVAQSHGAIQEITLHFHDAWGNGVQGVEGSLGIEYGDGVVFEKREWGFSTDRRGRAEWNPHVSKITRLWMKVGDKYLVKRIRLDIPAESQSNVMGGSRVIIPSGSHSYDFGFERKPWL